MKVFKIASLLALLVSSYTYSNPIVIDTSLWTQTVSPSSNRQSTNDTWVRLASNTPTKLSNSSGSLISDFSVDGDFDYSGIFSPTFATNSGCFAENTCDDDDILGIVFGWQDADNHYRLGWSQGDGQNSSSATDITGRTGLFLVKEVDGVSNTIQNWADDFWLENIEYQFNIFRISDSINIMIDGIVSDTPGSQNAEIPTTPLSTGISKLFEYSFNDTDFSSGKVGVYTESQTAVFSSLNVTVPVAIAAPGAIVLVLLSGFVLLRNKRKLKKI